MVFAVPRADVRCNGDNFCSGGVMKEEELTSRLSAASPRECAALTKKIVGIKISGYEKQKRKNGKNKRI